MRITILILLLLIGRLAYSQNSYHGTTIIARITDTSVIVASDSKMKGIGQADKYETKISIYKDIVYAAAGLLDINNGMYNSMEILTHFIKTDSNLQNAIIRFKDSAITNINNIVIRNRSIDKRVNPNYLDGLSQNEFIYDKKLLAIIFQFDEYKNLYAYSVFIGRDTSREQLIFDGYVALSLLNELPDTWRIGENEEVNKILNEYKHYKGTDYLAEDVINRICYLIEAQSKKTPELVGFPCNVVKLKNDRTVTIIR